MPQLSNENRIDIKSLFLDEVKQSFSDLSLPSFRAKQVFSWLCRGVDDFALMTDISKDLSKTLNEKYEIKTCKIAKKLCSQLDETVKYLFELNDGELLESVVMKYKHGYSICISTQIGCKMGCSFCASGLNGFIRNLTPSEMLSQITAAQNDLNIRISNIVLMGMGEPLDNFDNVVRFLKLVSNEDGLNIGLRHISLSTSGIVPKIYELSQLNLPITLSVSLHAPNDKIRSSIMKVNDTYGVQELICACKKYFECTGRRISYEYAIIKDVNDTPECARQLASLLKDTCAHINLIPANPVNENDYKTPNRDNIIAFQNLLVKYGLNATIRRTLGRDINASCGQLRNRNKR